MRRFWPLHRARRTESTVSEERKENQVRRIPMAKRLALPAIGNRDSSQFYTVSRVPRYLEGRRIQRTKRNVLYSGASSFSAFSSTYIVFRVRSRSYDRGSNSLQIEADEPMKRYALTNRLFVLMRVRDGWRGRRKKFSCPPDKV